MKKKLSIIMIFLMSVIFLWTLTGQVFAAGSFSISKSSVSLTEGGSTTFKISASSCEGKFTISSSDSGIAKVSSSSEWIKDSATITITAVKAGTAKITITASDVADTSEQEVTGSKTISVTVKAKSTSSSSNNNSNSNSNSGSTKKEPKFTSVNQTMYTTGEVNIRKSYSTSSAIIKTVEKGTKVTRTGIGDNGWSKITYNGQTAYISSSLLTATKPAEDKPKTEEPKSNTTTNQTTNTEVTNNEDVNNTTEPVNNEVDNSNTDNENAVLGLSKLEIAGVNFSEGFDPSIHSYTLKLNFFVKDLNITAEANKADAKVEIIGNENFEEGENNVTILVSSADNKETATYQIKVTIPSEVASSPQNNIQFYLMCGTIILAAIVVIGIIVSIYKKKNKSEVDYKDSKTDDDMLDPYTDIKPKKEKAKSGKHSN